MPRQQKNLRYTLPNAPLLMLVSDSSRLGQRSLEDIFFPALAGGVNMVLLREADLPPRDVLVAAQRLRKLALGGVPLFIHDRVDVAVAAQADGVHLDADGLPTAAARKVAKNFLVGRTVASMAEAVAAEQAGADYLVVEPVFPTRYARGRTPLGPPTIRHLASRIRIPILASGGLTAGNAHQVIAAGAIGVSVISEIVEAENPEEAARDLVRAMRSAWEARPLMRESLQ